MRLLFLLLTLMLGFTIGSAQSLTLEEQFSKEQKERKIRIANYLKNNPSIAPVIWDGDNSYNITDIVNGQPIYTGIHNEDVAISIGVNELRENGSLGLNLSGEGVRVGVWDQRVPRETHQEFIGQITINEAGEVSDHATHVLGTINAKGVRTDARGLAYNADAVAYDWNDDASEMLTEASALGLLVSNHSYGPLAGWVPSLGQWFGDANVSTEEDYKFGFYDNRARSWDAIIVQHPYYTIVKSAGNDRGDSGNGSFPPDGAFDVIATYATAKNIITVGAVQKNAGGDLQPQDIQMSSFSSWGPTDDGRIKPDICAPGVQVLSPIGSSDNSYANFNGTSMASPAVAASCVLLQQAHKTFNGEFMRSATLKGLIIHTAYEAGAAQGPDYQFGWGMINVGSAGEFLVNEDGINKFIIEGEIKNGETLEYELNPVAGKKITATLSWTDQPGEVPAISLDPEDLILVNDLDMRIADESGKEESPWVLNPATPGIAATKGDNFRDNVERIEFENPEQRKYIIRINHKGNLTGESQPFSLIVSYESENTGLTNLYWIGNSGDWSNAANWSFSSGGTSANIIPDQNYKVVFDENSFAEAESYNVNLTDNVAVGSIVWLANETVSLNMNGFTLSADNTSQLAQENLSVNNGSINLNFNQGDLNKIFTFENTSSDRVSINVTNENTTPWTFIAGSTPIDSLVLLKGNVNMIAESPVSINHIVLNDDVSLNVEGVEIMDLQSLIVRTGGSLQGRQSELMFNDTENGLIDINNVMFDGKFLIKNASMNINNVQSNIGDLSSENSSIRINNSIIMDLLSLSNSKLEIADGLMVTLQEAIFLESETLGSTEINSSGSAIINLIPHEKFCFDDIVVTNVDLAGESSVSLGETGSAVNAANWFVGNCDALIFSDFEVEFNCAKGLTYFTDKSQGSFTNRDWSIEGEPLGNEEQILIPFDTPGTRTITLTVNDGTTTSVYSQDIDVKANTLDSNWVILNSTQVASFKVADRYQWLRDGNFIVNSTERTHIHSNWSGVYNVLTFDETCNRLSSPVTLTTSTSSEEIGAMSVFPNPVNGDFVYIEHSLINIDELDLAITNNLGQIVFRQNKVIDNRSIKLNISELSSGVYYLNVSADKKTNVYKLIIN